jgi:hypothetical protein
MRFVDFTALFCNIDDFCKTFQTEWESQLLVESKKTLYYVNPVAEDAPNPFHGRIRQWTCGFTLYMRLTTRLCHP